MISSLTKKTLRGAGNSRNHNVVILNTPRHAEFISASKTDSETSSEWQLKFRMTRQFVFSVLAPINIGAEKIWQIGNIWYHRGRSKYLILKFANPPQFIATWGFFYGANLEICDLLSVILNEQLLESALLINPSNPTYTTLFPSSFAVLIAGNKSVSEEIM